MKRLIFLVTFVTSTAVADWLDDIVALVEVHNTLPSKEAQEIIKKYIKKDKGEIDSLEIKECKESGFCDSVKMEAQLVAAETSLKYHESVAKYLAEVTRNKYDCEAFVKEAKKLHLLEKQLADLQKKFHAKEHATKKAKLGAQVAAKKAQVVAQRAYMKAVKPR